MVISYQTTLVATMRKYFTTLIVIGCIIASIFAIRRNFMQFNSIVSIRNSQWEKVHIQVRKGFSDDPSRDQLIFDQFLDKGQSRSFSVDNGDDIVYRRDLNPNHPDGKHFTEWSYANNDGSTICSVDTP